MNVDHRINDEIPRLRALFMAGLWTLGGACLGVGLTIRMSNDGGGLVGGACVGLAIDIERAYRLCLDARADAERRRREEREDAAAP